MSLLVKGLIVLSIGIAAYALGHQRGTKSADYRELPY